MALSGRFLGFAVLRLTIGFTIEITSSDSPRELFQLRWQHHRCTANAVDEAARLLQFGPRSASGSNALIE